MNNELILASKSPRRIQMMKQHGFDPVVYPSQADENLPEFISPKSAVMFLAFLKAWDVTTHIAEEYTDNEDFTVIGSDTVVVYDNKIIGKPIDAEDAFNTLSQLRNNKHSVITGVSIIKSINGQFIKKCFYEETFVYFKDYTDEELTAYVHTDEPYDKAGGYAIQETFGKYVDHIEGDYDNVVGFPITRVIEHL